MEITDISQEVFTCRVYPGDSKPQGKTVNQKYDKGSYNITDFSMCAHNGTHVDAPFHFIEGGKTVDKMSLDSLVGKCFVYGITGNISAVQAQCIIDRAKATDSECAKRILLKGDCIVTEEAAKVFRDNLVLLVGTESQSVGPVEAPAAVHRILLDAETVLLEGLDLCKAQEGVYLLNAAPINLGGCDGAPCRAILIKM